MSIDEAVVEADDAGRRTPGRPRAPHTDERILDAALRLMAQQGFVRMSMDAVAAEAGVTRPTIYRRWPSKIELAMAALVAYCDVTLPAVVGDTRTDLIAELEHFRQAILRPNGMSLLGTVLAEEQETPELLAAFRQYLVVPRRQRLAAILAAAQTRNELDEDADLGLAVNMLVGALYAQYLAATPFAADWSTRVVDAVLASLRQDAASGADFHSLNHFKGEGP
jgi:AcrR family transcriptional regulator